MIDCVALNLQVPSYLDRGFTVNHCSRVSSLHHFRSSVSFSGQSTFLRLRISGRTRATSLPMEVNRAEGSVANIDSSSSMKLLFVEMGVGYDQHGQDITAAAMRACRDAISSNSIPAFRRGSIPGVSFDQMKLKIKLGVPRSLQQSLDIEKVKSVFP